MNGNNSILMIYQLYHFQVINIQEELLLVKNNLMCIFFWSLLLLEEGYCFIGLKLISCGNRFRKWRILQIRTWKRLQLSLGSMKMLGNNWRKCMKLIGIRLSIEIAYILYLKADFWIKMYKYWCYRSQDSIWSTSNTN